MPARCRFPSVAIAAALLAAPPARAQVPAPIAGRVATLVADRWRVSADRVRLEWKGVSEADLVDTTGARVELLGDRGGWFTLVLPAARGPNVYRWSVRAGVAESTLVAAHALPRQTVVGASDVVDSVVVRWGRPPARRPGRIGWVTRRPVNAGEPLDEPTVEPPPVIASGDPVQFIWQRGQIQLTLTGVAVGQTDAPGGPARVRLSNGRLLSGIAIGPHRVRAITN